MNEQTATATAERRSADVPEPERGGQLAIRSSSMGMAMARAQMGLMPQTLGEAAVLAGKLANATCIPRSLRKRPDDVLAVVLQGMELGLSPIVACNNVSIISGNMAMRGKLQLALVRKSGLLEFFDEGFDTSDPDPLKHYGWCEMRRKGDDSGNAPEVKDESGRVVKPRRHRKTFSVQDAKKVEIKQRGGDGDDPEEYSGPSADGSKPKKYLADQFQYKNWPERMYPMRARTWLIDALFSDVTLGLEAVENLESGQVIEAEVLEEPRGSAAQDVNELIDSIRDQDQELAGHIQHAFEVLDWGHAKQLVALRRFQGKDPKDLLEFLRDEYAGLKTGKERVKPSANHPVEAKQQPEPQPAAKDGQVVEPQKEQQVAQAVDAIAKAIEQPKQPEPPKPAAPKTATERLKGAKDLNFD